jgi:hypothetical protein
VILRLAVQDVQTYLFDTGWRREQRTWNNASTWSNVDGYEVLVPSSDELADTDLRVREIISALTAVEGRSAEEIASDINTPFDDVQLYRTFSDDDFISLATGLLVLRSVRDLISAAVRTVVDGPHPVFPGGSPRLAGELLRLIRLGSNRPADHLFTVRIPLIPISGSSDDQPVIADGVTPSVGRSVTSCVLRSLPRSLRPRVPPDTTWPSSTSPSPQGCPRICARHSVDSPAASALSRSRSRSAGDAGCHPMFLRMPSTFPAGRVQPFEPGPHAYANSAVLLAAPVLLR